MTGYTFIPLSINLPGSGVLERGNGELEDCINNVLDLIVFTPKGTFSADPEFGFEYWNHEFSNVDVREFNNSYIGIMGDAHSLNDVSRRQCELSLRESIIEYEPRLINPEVKIELEINDKIRKKRSQSKYEMKIMISGSIDDGLGIARPFEKRICFMVEPTVKKISI
ncbi:MAG: hypothetical protein K2G23_07190 [Muribaculaceae bacterium]|nr:hypothetical protein [Muribaculaceae bacterium]